MGKAENQESSIKGIIVSDGVSKGKVSSYCLRISLILMLGAITRLEWMPQPADERSVPPKSQLAALNEALKSDESAKLVVPFVRNLGQYADAGVKYVRDHLKMSKNGPFENVYS